MKNSAEELMISFNLIEINKRLKKIEWAVLILVVHNVVVILENNNVIHVPVVRYCLSFLFLFFFIQYVFIEKKISHNLFIRFLIFLLVAISLITFLRGMDSDELRVKKFISGTYSFYFFPLLLFLDLNRFSLKYVFKGFLFLTTVASVILIFNISYWISNAFLLDQLSRVILTISGILFLIIYPVKPQYKSIIIFNFLVAIAVNIAAARRAESSLLLLILLFTSLPLGVTTKVNQRVFNILVYFLLFLLLSFSTFFNNLFSRFEEGYENRDDLFVDLKYDLTVSDTWFFGKGAAGAFDSQRFGEERQVIEHGYYSMILNSGVLYVFVFVFIALIAVHRGVFRSNNRISKRLSAFIIFYMILMFGHGVLEFTYRSFFLWFAIALCLSTDFSRMSDSEVLAMFNEGRFLHKNDSQDMKVTGIKNSRLAS